MPSHAILTVLTLATLAASHPVLTTTPRNPTISAANLIQIAPSTASCASAPFPAECATADTAAPAIACSFRTHNITTFPAQAALVALQLYETANFQYSKNHYPGVPGQGTRNMQSPAFNAKYAAWLAENCPSCGSAVPEAQGPAAVLDWINRSDESSFGSAAWFVRTQCAPGVLEGLDAGTLAGWQTYIEQCVGTTLTDDRTAGWQKVVALGSW